jgi:hypothetical protein
VSCIHCHCIILRTSKSSYVVFFKLLSSFFLFFLKNVLFPSFFSIAIFHFFCKHFLHHIVICYSPQFIIHKVVGCSNVLVFIATHFVQLFTITCHSSMVLLPITLSVVHCSNDYSSVKCVHCCYFLIWLLATEALRFFVHRSSALVATCHSSSKKFNTKICLLPPILEKLEPEVILKS